MERRRSRKRRDSKAVNLINNIKTSLSKIISNEKAGPLRGDGRLSKKRSVEDIGYAGRADRIERAVHVEDDDNLEKVRQTGKAGNTGADNGSGKIRQIKIDEYIGRTCRFLKSLRPLALPILVTAVVMGIIAIVARLLSGSFFVIINNVNQLTSLFVVILSASTWIGVQRLRNSRPKVPTTPGSDSAIVIIDIGKIQIEGDVRVYCEKEETFRGMMHGAGFRRKESFEELNDSIGGTGFAVGEIEADERVVVMSKGRLQEIADTAEHVYKAFRGLASALHQNGISDLYIFYAGPVVVPFYIGELLSNQFKVYIYKYPGSNGSKYDYSGLMNHLEYLD
jgi:hypothetical protein